MKKKNKSVVEGYHSIETEDNLSVYTPAYTLFMDSLGLSKNYSRSSRNGINFIKCSVWSLMVFDAFVVIDDTRKVVGLHTDIVPVVKYVSKKPEILDSYLAYVALTDGKIQNDFYVYCDDRHREFILDLIEEDKNE